MSGGKLFLMRHGQSLWNKLNIFTGWIDVPLSCKGIEESIAGGELLANEQIDYIFTSELMRAQMTAMIAISRHRSEKVPIILKNRETHEDWYQIGMEKQESSLIPTFVSWHLNERMYGDLQGGNKSQAAKIHGEEQIHIWRRSFDTPPPNGESLEITAKRTIPFFEEKIAPLIKNQKNVFIVAHGNSLRSIIMDLENLNSEEVVKLELKTGVPITYIFEEGKFTKEC